VRHADQRIHERRGQSVEQRDDEHAVHGRPDARAWRGRRKPRRARRRLCAARA
jgi:hypothetical protein